MSLYARIGPAYLRTRRADPRIEAVLAAALGDASTVVNVGAGTGSYEPADRQVLAVEPSAEMRAQRPPGAAPCLDAAAEALPLPTGGVDAAMALYTDFHWHNRARGVAELVRVSADRVLILTVDRRATAGYWLFRDYFPTATGVFADLDELLSELPGRCQVRAVPIPCDCLDGFVHAYWRRPGHFLDPALRATMAAFACLEPEVEADGIRRLADDLASGEWRRRNLELYARRELDLGHRLVLWRRPAQPSLV